MRNRKLFSTVMATTLAVTTMAMPVMAADGEVDVNLTTKKAVMRVQVPTSMAVEIDQYAIDEAGCQIACVDEFDMKNLSEMAVKVVVDSTVTLKSGVTLASGKEAASGSASGDVAWLAIAAQTSGDVYDDKSTTDVETCGTLSELNANVTTFSQTSATEGKAEQTFYLAKGSGAASYKMVTSGDAAKVKFARFYELGGEMNTEADVKEKLKESDVYVASGDAITKYEKGTETITFAATDKGYVISGDATDATGNGKYMYGEMANADGKGEAAFRYVGNLSEVNGEQWSKEKIQGIHIAYDITGVTADTYAEAEKQCTYGLYAAGPQVSVNADGVVSIKNLDGSLYSSMTVNDGTGDFAIPNDNKEGTWEWDDDDAATLKTFTFNSAWSGSTVTVTITLTDGTKITSNSVTIS